MKALLFATNEEYGYAIVTPVNYPENETVSGESKFVVRPPGTSIDFHTPVAGKSFIVSVLRGQLSITRKSAGGPESVTIGEGMEHHTAIFQDWSPAPSLCGKSGHRSAVVGPAP